MSTAVLLAYTEEPNRFFPAAPPPPTLPYDAESYVDALEHAHEYLKRNCNDPRRLADGKSDIVGAINAYYATRKRGKHGIMRDLKIPIDDYNAIVVKAPTADGGLPTTLAETLERGWHV